eukprot:jgi/Psemu1/294751/fgenesh1_pm.29_\
MKNLLGSTVRIRTRRSTLTCIHTGFKTQHRPAYSLLTVATHVSRMDNEESSSLQKLGHSLVNTLVMVSVICVMTFVVVLCYKYRCMSIFYAYMVLATAALLGYFTSNILLVAMSIYPWMNPDKLTFAFLIYNYATVGTIAIFLPRGIPQWVTQGYLIASSVCLAWQLSYFGSWMAWTLLVMLALYDLFAVLTPCGPLKALAELISEEGAPALPGLLYEAKLPSGVSKHDGKNNRRRQEAMESREENESEERGNETISDQDNQNNDDIDVTMDVPGKVSSMRKAVGLGNENELTMESQTDQQLPEQRKRQIQRQREQQMERQNGEEEGSLPKKEETMHLPFPAIDSVDFSNHGQVPLALAKVYQLPVLDASGILGGCRGVNRPRDRQDLVYLTGEEIRSMTCTEQQLITEVTCVFPPRGGRIARARSRDQIYDAGTAYIVYDRTGDPQRKLIVTPQGSVMEVRQRESSPTVGNEAKDEADNSTIKLGLGDFIFYSVLVSKAAQYSFTTFAACLLVVLSGLAATLVILAIRGKALPALPISIFLGVIAFLWTRSFIQPWIRDFLPRLIYV